jgi:hypothetical protein
MVGYPTVFLHGHRPCSAAIKHRNNGVAGVPWKVALGFWPRALVAASGTLNHTTE